MPLSKVFNDLEAELGRLEVDVYRYSFDADQRKAGQRPYDKRLTPRRLITLYCVLLHMPISIDHFDEGPADILDLQEGTQPYHILQFLAENNEEAFTQTEIHEATDIKRGSVGGTLSRLEERGLVRHRGRYWAIAEDDRLASYAAQTQASSDSTTDDYYGEE